jgi:hypothetical protein
MCGERKIGEGQEGGHVDSKGGGQGLAVIKARESPGVSEPRRLGKKSRESPTPKQK